MTRHSTEEEQQRQRAQQLRAEQLQADMRWLMGDPRGRRLVWQWLGDAGLYRMSFVGDALQTAFREGERNRALRLLADVMEHCPGQFIEMQVEHAASGAHTGGAAPHSAAP